MVVVYGLSTSFSGLDVGLCEPCAIPVDRKGYAEGRGVFVVRVYPI